MSRAKFLINMGERATWKLPPESWSSRKLKTMLNTQAQVSDKINLVILLQAIRLGEYQIFWIHLLNGNFLPIFDQFNYERHCCQKIEYFLDSYICIDCNNLTKKNAQIQSPTRCKDNFFRIFDQSKHAFCCQKTMENDGS